MSSKKGANGDNDAIAPKDPISIFSFVKIDNFFGNFFKKKIAIVGDHGSKNYNNLYSTTKGDERGSYISNNTNKKKQQADFKDKLEKMITIEQKLGNKFLMKGLSNEKRYSNNNTMNTKIDKKTIVSPSTNKYVITKKIMQGSNKPDENTDHYYELGYG